MDIDEQARMELEAAAFQRLVEHLKGLSLDKAGVREIICGMPYDDWKEKFQT